MDIDKLPANTLLVKLFEEWLRRKQNNKLFSYYPDVGEYRRELYPKHQAFLAAGAKNRIRMMMAANRIGKTEGCGLYETTLHMTGRYPAWWRGKRFDRPVKVWVCGDTGKTIRTSLQPKLLGPWKKWGLGLVPGDDIVNVTSKAGVAEAIDTFTVRHINGGTSYGEFKSYDQGVDAFEAAEVDVILLDEEPPLDVYGECLVRTMTTNGIIMLTFTPLSGVTKLIKHMRESKVWEINATWDDVPHLTQSAKDELWKGTPEYMREARAKGIPARGSGVVFPVSEFKITCPMFSPPAHWPAIIGLDFGWDHPSAAVKTVHNRDEDIFYVVGCHRQREASPLTFAAGIKSWGTWCPVAWPHDGLQHNRDLAGGRALSELYAAEGMNMLPEPASFSDEKLEHAVEPGIMEMLTYMQSGRFYVMEHLSDWFAEFRDYYRKDGIIVKEADDLLSATRYAFMMRRHAEVKPRPRGGGAATKPNWRIA